MDIPPNNSMSRMNPVDPFPNPPIQDDALTLWLRHDGPGCLVENRLADGVILGPYRVLGLLGRGGSAEVYRAVRINGGDIVALKVPHRRDDAPASERFRREARLLAEHPHPALPRLVDSGEADGLPWLAMEELFPGDLPRKPRDVERFLLSLCQGIAHLHALGLVHRDIKPGNILCRADGTPVLIDLGLVKESTEAHPFPVGNAPLSVVDGRAVGHGTPGWAAPEQFSGGDISPAADVYALGMLALDCFDGRAPRLWRPLLRRATSPLPAERPPNAAAFAKALRHRYRPLWWVAAVGLAIVAIQIFIVRAVPSVPTVSFVSFPEYKNSSDVGLRKQSLRPAPELAERLGLPSAGWWTGTDYSWLPDPEVPGGIQSGQSMNSMDSILAVPIKSPCRVTFRYRRHFAGDAILPAGDIRPRSYFTVFSADALHGENMELQMAFATFDKASVLFLDREGDAYVGPLGEERTAVVDVPVETHVLYFVYHHGGTGYINQFNGVRIDTIHMDNP